jgi:signal transduction histidine kinase
MEDHPATARPDGLRTRASWWPPLVDVWLAVGIGVVQLVIAIVFSAHMDDGQELDALGGALIAGAGLVLVFRRRHPVATFYGALAATAGYFALEYEGGPVFWALIVAFVTTVLAGRRVAAAIELCVGYTVMVTLVWAAADEPPWAFAFGLAAWLLVLFSAAEFGRARRERAAEAARRREEEARRQVTEERLRIARELHDVVAHNISLVNLQASVALHLIDQQPAQARTALATIKDASKEALVELRSVLGVLRQADEDEAAAPRAPAPGLDRLDDLVAQASSAGVDVRVTAIGAPRPLPAGLDLAAFRIVQEALTNVARHAAPTAAEVRLAYGDDLVVEVVDEGRRLGAPAPPAAAGLGSGHGLVGMRERAEAAGGTLEAGPRPGRGWRVRLRLPLPAPAEPEPAGPEATQPEPAEPAPDEPAAEAPAGGQASGVEDEAAVHEERA